MKSKKAFSQIVAMIFLILVALLAVGIFWVFITNLLEKESTRIEDQGSFNCLKNVDMAITSACFNGNVLEIELKNKRELTLGDFFLIIFTYEDGTIESVPTPPETYLEGYQTRKILMEYKSGLKEIKVIPKIESQVFLCEDIAPEYRNIQECKNE